MTYNQPRAHVTTTTYLKRAIFKILCKGVLFISLCKKRTQPLSRTNRICFFLINEKHIVNRAMPSQGMNVRQFRNSILQIVVYSNSSYEICPATIAFHICHFSDSLKSHSFIYLNLCKVFVFSSPIEGNSSGVVSESWW